MSSLPDVLSLVTMRSNAFPRASARADRLSGTLTTAHEPGSRTRNRIVWTSGLAPTTSAFLTAKGRLSVFGAELIYFPRGNSFCANDTDGISIQTVISSTAGAQVCIPIFPQDPDGASCFGLGSCRIKPTHSVLSCATVR